jgi:hypothetical protein
VARSPALTAGVALAALLVVAYLLWWPSLLQALPGMHGPVGGGLGMHGLQ